MQIVETILFFSVIIQTCFSSEISFDGKKLAKLRNEEVSAPVVQFKLKKKSQSAFNYTDKYGNFKQVLFDKVPRDTSFLQKFTSTVPVELYYSFGVKIPFIIMPGDTVTVEVGDDTIHATSKNFSSAEINFFNSLNKGHQSIFDYERLSHSIKLPKRLSVLDSFYKYSTVFLENQKDNFSAELYSICLSAVNYEYFRHKLIRFSVDKNDRLPGLADSVINLIEEKNHFLNEMFHLIQVYNWVKLGSDFNSPDYQIRMYDSSSNFYQGKIRDRMLLTQLIGIRNKSPKFLAEYVAKFDKDCGDPDFRKFVKENFAGDKNTLDDELTNLASEITNWAKLLEREKGKVIYVDFWASWCIPCRKELPGARELIRAFEGDAFSYIFISIDDLPTSWKEACLEENLNSFKSNYLLSGSSQSKINKLLDISSIPRYVLINQKGEIIDRNAPPPLEMLKNNLIRKLIKG